MHLADIYRYPVKSMLGEPRRSAYLGVDGIPGDRAWALRDEVAGELTGAKKHPRLMSMTARFASEPDVTTRSPPVRITDTDGLDITTEHGEVNARLSERLNHPVSVWPLLPAGKLDHYRRAALPRGADVTASLRALFGRAEDEPLPDVARFPEVLATHHSPPGTYFDAYPLLVMTRSSLAALTAAAAASGIRSNFDLRRFRPNLLIDTDQEGFVENAWEGRRLRVGQAELAVEMPCPRCIMTTHPFLELPKDPKIMRALVRHNDGNLGVYASVVREGWVRVGDAALLI